MNMHNNNNNNNSELKVKNFLMENARYNSSRQL